MEISTHRNYPAKGIASVAVNAFVSLAMDNNYKSGLFYTFEFSNAIILIEKVQWPPLEEGNIII